MAQPLHRHQRSLESVIDPSATAGLSPHERAQAVCIFQQILKHCDSYEQSHTLGPERKYKRGKLLELVYEYAISDYGRDNILRYFLTAITPPEESLGTGKGFSHVLANLDDFEERSIAEKDQILNRLQELADHLIDCFFLPIKASSAKTPQPTPNLSPQPRPDNDILVGTTQRLSSLRGVCLERDRHRCTISRLFDAAEATRRFGMAGAEALDDDGSLLKYEETEYLEVAHIIPHALVLSDEPFMPLNESKVYALRILDMFDPGILHWVEGTNIDRPYNALTLSAGLHRRFGNLEVYFEAMPEMEHTYTIKCTSPFQIFQPRLPVTRELFITPHRNIEPPMPRLLAIHRACCLILHISGAGGYIDKVLRDMEESTARSDGTTELGSLVNLRLQTLDQQATAY